MISVSESSIFKIKLISILRGLFVERGIILENDFFDAFLYGSFVISLATQPT